MKCEICGIDTGLYALSDKPDPGYGYNTHTWEQCARQLLMEAADNGRLRPYERGEGDLKARIAKLLATEDERRKRIAKAIRDLEHANK